MSTYRKVAAVILLGLLLSIVEAGPARSFAIAARAYKIPRSIRAPYRNGQISTARGFGKRDTIGIPLKTNSDDVNAAYNGISKFTDDQRESFEKNENHNGDIVALEWMVNELSQNPELARAILQKFVDKNEDGYLSARELLGSANDCSESF